MTDGSVRLALIGLGKMGMEHLGIFATMQPQVRICALADSHAPFAERAASLVPDAVVFHDPLDCVDEADVDAVVVATADDTHHRIVDKCIARGLFVLCEKPLTTSADHSWQLVSAERAGGHRLVQVGFMRRFDADYQTLHESLRAGDLGEPVLISQRHHNPLAVIDFDERQLVSSSASHDIDVFRWLCGEEVEAVSAITKSSRDGDTVIVVLTLTSQSGVLGVMSLGRGPGLPYDIGCEIVGNRGGLTLPSPAPTDDWMQRFCGAYRAQDAAWLAAVAARRQTGASSYDGYASNTVIDAALASLDSGRPESVRRRAASLRRNDNR